MTSLWYTWPHPYTTIPKKKIPPMKKSATKKAPVPEFKQNADDVATSTSLSDDDAPFFNLTQDEPPTPQPTDGSCSSASEVLNHSMLVLLQRSKAQDATIAELRSQQQSSDDNALHNTPPDFAGFPAAFRSFIFARLMKLCLNLMDRGEASRAQLDRLLKLREEVLTYGISNEWPDAAAKFHE